MRASEKHVLILPLTTHSTNSCTNYAKMFFVFRKGKLQNNFIREVVCLVFTLFCATKLLYERFHMSKKLGRQRPVWFRFKKPSHEAWRNRSVLECFDKFLVLQGRRRLPGQPVRDFCAPIRHSGQVIYMDHAIQVSSNEVSSTDED